MIPAALRVSRAEDGKDSGIALFGGVYATGAAAAGAGAALKAVAVLCGVLVAVVAGEYGMVVAGGGYDRAGL